MPLSQILHTDLSPSKSEDPTLMLMPPYTHNLAWHSKKGEKDTKIFSSSLAINQPRNFIHLICYSRVPIKQHAWFSVTRCIHISSFVIQLNVIYDTICWSLISYRKKRERKKYPFRHKTLTGAQIWILKEARYLSTSVTQRRIWQNSLELFIVRLALAYIGKRNYCHF